MAIIYPSALINRISGRIGEVVYSWYKGRQIAKVVSTTPSVPLTARTAQIRNTIRYLSPLYTNLTVQQKRLWQSYAIHKIPHATGRNAFISLNGVVLNASNTDFTVHFSPPATPSTPRSVFGLAVSYLSADLACISWTRPRNSCDYVYAVFRLPGNFCTLNPDFGLCPTTGYTPDFRFIVTVRSDSGSIAFNHQWPVGTQLFFRARTIDLHGRRSPWSSSVEFFNNP